MPLRNKLDSLTIRGFQSIQRLDNFPLNDLNVLIGPNGAGKSNFVNYFRMLREMVEQNLQLWVTKRGGADRLLTFGVKETSELFSHLQFGDNGYQFTLEPTDAGNLVFRDELLFYQDRWPSGFSMGGGNLEARLKDEVNPKQQYLMANYAYNSISSWQIYHFHDTSDTAGVKRYTPLNHNKRLEEDAANLAAFLHRIRAEHPNKYNFLRRLVQRAVPHFNDFILDPITRTHPDNLEIRLEWRGRGSDYPMWPTQLSDGSIRFICLATALLQPEPPTTIIIDEPELGLHPSALGLLGGLVRGAVAEGVQVILATQSVPFLNQFDLDEIIVTEMDNGLSRYQRLSQSDFAHWLEDYTVGELWEKNVLGGRP